MALLKTNTGIGITNPSEALHVIGNGLFEGIVSATSFTGNLSGTATSAINLVGGQQGSVPYQSSTNSTTFLSPGTAGQVLLTGGNGENPYWAPVSSASGSFGGITIQDEGDVVGSALSISSLNFVGSNITATASGAAATITIANNLVGTALSISGISTFTNGPVLIGSGTSTGTTAQPLQVTGGAYVSGNLGIGTTTPTSKLQVVGDVLVSGVVTATTFNGALTGSITGNAASADKLFTPRTISLTGDVAGSVSFDGTQNVSIAATIQPNSVALKDDTTGDYVESISGTANQITVTSGTGEGSTPTLSIPNQFTVPQDLTVIRDVQINRNLNVNGNITIGGTSATIFSQSLNVFDPDIVLGYRTDVNGNDVSNDNTANHGGVAIASTEGSPLVQLFIAGIETNPATYKKIMWFKAGTFAGLGTDAWLSNYAIGIGSTQFPTGTRLAAGSVQFTENDLAVVRNINASGIISATTFVGSFQGNVTTATYATNAGIATNLNGGASGSIPYQYSSGITSFLAGSSNNGWILTYDTANNAPIWSDPSSGVIVGTANYAINAGIATYATNAGIATYATNAGIATYATNAGIATYATNAGIATYATNAGIATYAVVAGIATYATNAGIATYATNAGIATYATNAGIATYATNAGISTNVIGGIGSITQLQVTGISTFTNGPVLVGAAISTGTTAQRLQVTGGAYVSGNLGIGTTNPTSKLQVVGDTNVSGVVTAFDFYNTAEYPNVRPTLDLAFAETKILDSRITFTRSSTATYVGADGLIKTAASGVARFDHNPATGESLGLLVEEARTNASRYSEQFDNAVWTWTSGAKSVTPNAITAPDGTLTADMISAASFIEIVSPDSVSGPKTFSVFFKAGTTSDITLRIFAGFSPFEVSADFNLLTGSITGQQGSSVSAVSIQPFPNGWYRCSLTRTDNTDFRPGFIRCFTGGTFYAWGAQLEAGAFPTSYIPTVASTVTRSADVASITGTNFSGWFNGSKQGTLFFNHDLNPETQVASTTNSMIVAFADSLTAYNNVIGYWGSGDQRYLTTNYYTGTPVEAYNSGNFPSYGVTLSNPGYDKYALAYTPGSGLSKAAINGVLLPAIDTPSAYIPTGFYFGGTHTQRINRLTYYPVRLPDAQLQTITL